MSGPSMDPKTDNAGGNSGTGDGEAGDAMHDQMDGVIGESFARLSGLLRRHAIGQRDVAGIAICGWE